MKGVIEQYRERKESETWLKRGLIKRSFGEGADLVVRVESGGQAVEQPLLILINYIRHSQKRNA